MNSTMPSATTISRTGRLALSLRIIALLLFVTATTAISIHPGPATLADSSRLLYDGLRASLN